MRAQEERENKCFGFADTRRYDSILYMTTIVRASNILEWQFNFSGSILSTYLCLQLHCLQTTFASIFPFSELNCVTNGKFFFKIMCKNTETIKQIFRKKMYVHFLNICIVSKSINLIKTKESQ